jgi:F-type H+-transporting ATPase subunit a
MRMHLSPDQLVLWEHGFIKVNATLAFTWGIMLAMTVAAILVTRGLSGGEHGERWRNLMEIIVLAIEKQIRDVGLATPRPYLPFLGTIFLFVAVSSMCAVIPGYQAPTASLSTTTALALCVFVAVPVYGIRKKGLGAYLSSYVKPTVLMLPFNVISEISRTVALAVRLFGNMMSGAMILGILLTITPFLSPIVMAALGLLTGMIQAYIFFILATVYIAAAASVRAGGRRPEDDEPAPEQEHSWTTQP